MAGAVRALGTAFVDASDTESDWARHDQKHGLPILQIEEPHFGADDVEQGAGAGGASTFYDQFQEIGEGVLRLPQPQGTDERGWAARWMELSQSSWASFPAHLKRTSELSRRVLLGRDSSEVAKGGDGESAMGRIKMEFLASDAEPLAVTLREQVWKPFGRFNYANWSDELAPWGRWDTRPKADMHKRAETLLKAAEAMVKLREVGVETDEIWREFA